MCGIAGIIEYSGENPSKPDLETMTQFMFHRGPDGEGIYIDGPVGFGHRRLSIIDIEHGAQPMVSPCGQYAITFNGEIYNFVELREELKSKGVQFRTGSDTEVLLQALICYGKDVLPRLNGMFAFAFYNKMAGSVLLARDHLGIKPLYYYQGNDRLLFASDIGAVACHQKFPRQLSHLAVSHFLSWRVVPNPYGIYENTWQLEPGHYLETDLNGKSTTKCYWDIPSVPVNLTQSPEQLEEELRELLYSSMKMQVRSDVPVGAFLSGGVDSSIISYWLTQVSDNPLTFTIGFSGSDASFDESEWANDVAKYLNTNHHVDFLKVDHIESELKKITYYFNQPCGTGIPNYFVSKIARKYVKVALSGVGGDELFAGYGRFKLGLNKPTSLAVDLFLRSQMSFTEQDKQQFFSKDFYESVLNEPSLAFIKDKNKIYSDENTINKLSCIDCRHFMLNDLLFNLDKMSMAHSLEVRVPLIDYRIAEYAMKLPQDLKIRGNLQKIMLKRSIYHNVPKHVCVRQKHGFSLPKELWIKQLKGHIYDLLNEETIRRRNIFDYQALQGYLNQVFKQDKISWRDTNNIWNIFSFELWAKDFLDRRPTPMYGQKQLSKQLEFRE